MTRLRAAAVLTLLVGLSLGASLGYDFVWDDAPLIVENRLVQDPSELGTVLTSSFWQTGDRHDRFRAFFRPLVAASYAADYALWGPNPRGFHLTNLLLHWLCCWLIYRIALAEGLTERASLAAAALFAVHPVHVESVAWISGRTDLLCAFLVLGAFLLQRRPGRTRLVASWIVFAVSLFAKEMAATLPALVFLDRWLRDGDRGRRSLGRAGAAAAPYLVVLGLYFVARASVLGSGGEAIYSLSPDSFVATALFVTGRYLTLLLIPLGLDAHYPYAPLEGLLHPRALLGAAMLATLAGAAVLLYRRRARGLAWLLWIPVTLAPVMAFGRFGDVVMADRFLYIPSVGLSLLLARGIDSLPSIGARYRRTAVAALSAVVVLLAFASFERARVWKDDLTLFRGMARTSPDSALVRCNLGNALYRRGEVDTAIEEFRLAVRLNPSYAMAHNNLAAALDSTGRAGESLEHYRRALELAPGMVEPGANGGNLLVRLGRTAEGLALLTRTLRLHPRSTTVRYALADALDRAGRPEQALPHIARIQELSPRHPQSHYLLGKIRYEQGRTREAVASMKHFLELWDVEGPHAEAARRIIAQAEGDPGS